MANEKIPPPYTEQEAWLVDHRVCCIRTSYKMTGADTAQDYVTLESLSGDKVTWQVETFRKLAKLTNFISSTSSLAEPLEYRLRERIEARRLWEKKESADLAAYKRLKAKFEGMEQ